MICVWSLCGFLRWLPAVLDSQRVGTCENSPATHHLLYDIWFPSLAFRELHPCPAQGSYLARNESTASRVPSFCRWLSALGGGSGGRLERIWVANLWFVDYLNTQEWIQKEEKVVLELSDSVTVLILAPPLLVSVTFFHTCLSGSFGIPRRGMGGLPETQSVQEDKIQLWF